MPIAAVVADANVLLSAAVGRGALRVFNDHGIAVHVTEFNVAEVEEYLPRLSAKYALPEAEVRLSWQLLALRRHPPEAYLAELPRAMAALRGRDFEDAHALALAWALRLPLWTNDRDFEVVDVERYTTARLLGALDADPPSANIARPPTKEPTP